MIWSFEDVYYFAAIVSGFVIVALYFVLKKLK